jgi:hypothetical protein
MIPMLHGDNPNVASRLHSTDQTEVKTEENILLKEYFPQNLGEWIMTNKHRENLRKNKS